MTLCKLSKKDFSLLRGKNSKAFRTDQLLFFYQTSENVSEDFNFCYGFTVTKKKVRHAVGRNRIKRLLRVCVKKAQDSIELRHSVKVNIVYAPKSEKISSIKFHDLYKEVELFCRKVL